MGLFGGSSSSASASNANSPQLDAAMAEVRRP